MDRQPMVPDLQMDPGVTCHVWTDSVNLPEHKLLPGPDGDWECLQIFHIPYK